MSETPRPYRVYTAVINSNEVGLRHQRLAAELIMAEVDLSAWLADPSPDVEPLGNGLDLLERWAEAKDGVEEFWPIFESSSQQWRSTVGLVRLDEVLSKALVVIRSMIP